MSSITANGNTVIPDEIPPYVPQTAHDTNFILVQSNNHDLTADQKLDLATLGVEIQEYVSEHTYLCRFEPKDLDPIRAKSYVKNVTIYLREPKATSSLKDAVEREENKTDYEVDCILHDNPNVSAEELAPYVAEAAGVDVKELEVCPTRIRLTVHQDKLDALVKLDSLNRIEQVRRNKVFNDHARGILHADPLGPTTVSYQGAGQMVCVADTGFDQCQRTDQQSVKVHPAFTGRVERLDALWSSDSRDRDGHGTHVCGSVCGDGTYKHPQLGNISVRGTAPASRLMVQSLARGKGIATPLDLQRGLFSKPYELGAMPPPRTASRYINKPGAVPATNVNDTAVFSSRGPTKSGRDRTGKLTVGRVKPDVVAPGVAILSAASRNVAKNDKVRTEGGISGDDDWMFLTGTSMFTPLVAGCVALLREALQDQGKKHPSAALVKALLVNGAVNFSERSGLGYDYEQGFGRVDVERSITMIRGSSFIEGGSILETTQFDVAPLRQIPELQRQWSSIEIPVPSGRNRLAVTLAYPDTSGGELQNDINLIVRSGGVERHGNMGKGDGFDSTNNVEKVIWDNVPGSSFKIIVRIFNNLAPQAPAAFAVAWDIQPLPKL